MHFIHRFMRSTRLRNGFVTSLTLILGLIIVIPALADPGDLDTTWGGSGTVTIDLDGGGSAYQDLIKLLPYSGDKVIGLATYTDAPSRFVLVRFNDDGSLDNTFGTNGVFIVPLTPSPASADDTAADMVIQPDGKIVVVGNTYPANPGTVTHVGGVRVTETGTLDTTFDGDGYLDIDATNLELSLTNRSSYAASVTLQSDNKIIITGGMVRTGYDSAGMVIRLNTDGSRDTSFDGNGILAFDYVFGDANDNIVGAVVQPDGKIVVAGRSDSDATQFGVNYDFVAARFNTDGTLDDTFSGDGQVGVDVSLVEFGISNAQDSATSLILLDNGKIILAGSATNDTVNYAGDVALVRFNSDGSRDTSFGGNGIVTTAVNNRDEHANAIALQENGRFVVVGTADKPNSSASDSMILRYNSDGTLDNTFSDDGKLTFNFGSSSEFGYDVALQPDGKILVVATNGQSGVAGDVLFALRLEGNPGNAAPVLASIGNKTIDEGVQLSFTASATDADDPPQTLIFSLEAGAPAGANITADGDFTWTPSEARGPGTYPITVTVTDDGTPNKSDSETITVTVNEVNTPPVLANITNKTVNEGEELSLTASATDSDLPAQTLTYTLEPGFPAGAEITAGGDFTWTPSEAQGPGVYPITVRVTDSGPGNLSDTDSFNVTVNEVNTPPTLASIDDFSVDEGVLVSLTATATDSDEPANTLTFTLEPGFPAGANITPGGDFSWTPNENQGGGVFTITVRVTDNGTPAMFDTEDFTVTVNETNTAPVITDITDKTVDEGVLLSITATATDGDIPVQTLTYTLEPGFPAGAAITPGGVFTWTPDETQGGDVYTITVRVTDDGAGNLSATDTFTVTVNEVNALPLLTDITNQTVDEGSLLSFTATASDNDIPVQTLTFSLDAGFPAGAAITPGGDFTWTPSEAQGGSVYSITVRVTDNGAPNQSATDTFTVTVNEINDAPTINPIASPITADEGVQLSFSVVGADTDLPTQTLTYSLGATAPTGVNINPTSGLFTWTPDETQGGASYTFEVMVTDNGAPILSATQSITINVNEVNTAPELNPIGSKVVNELTLLTFTASAGDEDDPANTLTYSLDAPTPGNPTIDPVSGVFTWTPDDVTATTTYTLTVRVTDNGTPALDDFEIISVVVRNPSDVFDLANGGFEDAGATQKDALNWNETELTTTDRRICNTTTPLKVYANSGECAFRFQYDGITNLQRKVAQSMALPTVVVGDTIRLDFWAKANTLTNGVKVQLRLNYTDGTHDLVNLPIPTGTYAYTAFDIEIPVAKSLTNVRVMLLAGASNGSALFDDFTITRMVGAPLTMQPIDQRNGESGLIPLPAAPGDLRGGGSVDGK